MIYCKNKIDVKYKFSGFVRKKGEKFIYTSSSKME